MSRATMQPRDIAELHRRCVIEATIAPLVPFPRGFARSKNGPFYNPRTVYRLLQSGDLRMIMSRVGGKHGSVTARSA